MKLLPVFSQLMLGIKILQVFISFEILRTAADLKTESFKTVTCPNESVGLLKLRNWLNINVLKLSQR